MNYDISLAPVKLQVVAVAELIVKAIFLGAIGAWPWNILLRLLADHALCRRARFFEQGHTAIPDV